MFMNSFPDAKIRVAKHLSVETSHSFLSLPNANDYFMSCPEITFAAHYFNKYDGNFKTPVDMRDPSHGFQRSQH